MGAATLLERLDRSLARPPAPEPAAAAAHGIARRMLLTGSIGGLAIFAAQTLANPLQKSNPGLTVGAGGGQPDAPVPPPPPHLLGQPSGEDLRDYRIFRTRFIKPDGRVIDTGNHGVSHTESQGIGMLLAVAFNDRDSFDRIWNWTSGNLRRSSDALHAWRYVPGAANPVADSNNATDGDIYIAAALVRAASLWDASFYLQSGRAIARDILALLTREVGGRVVLLPGAEGFEAADHVIVNPSYYAFPLLADLWSAHPSPRWTRLIDDGHQLIEAARFGRWQLPPDWLSVSNDNGALALAAHQPPRFSFDAVRIPLFVAWVTGATPRLDAFADFWGPRPAAAPAWVDLTTNECAPYSACNGVVAIASLTNPSLRAAIPAIGPDDQYYSAALTMLSRLAARETRTWRA